MLLNRKLLKIYIYYASVLDIAVFSSWQGAEQVTHFCRLLHSPLTEESTMPEDFPPVKPLSDSQRIRKVIVELIETEKQYVKVSVNYLLIYQFKRSLYLKVI